MGGMMPMSVPSKIENRKSFFRPQPLTSELRPTEAGCFGQPSACALVGLFGGSEIANSCAHRYKLDSANRLLSMHRIQSIWECWALRRFGSRAGRGLGTASIRLLPILQSPQIHSAAKRRTPKTSTIASWVHVRDGRQSIYIRCRLLMTRWL
jgi:hypothetical protein